MNDPFSPIEHAFADNLLSCYPDHSSASLFLKTLLLAAKMGHVCLYIDEASVKPSLENIDEEELRDSLKSLPKELLQICDEDSTVQKPICQRGNYYYLQRYYIAETTVYREWQRLCNAFAIGKAPRNLEESLLEEQKQAIRLVCEQDFVILSGGPGTGKTYTAARMVKAVLENLPEEQRSHYRIALTAPTGKAAAHLESTIRKSFTEFSNVEIVGQTMHSLLGIRSNHRDVCGLPYDFILVDESSMIDIELMACLLESVPNGCKLVLIGDENQLPPVEAGSIFADLKAIHPYTVSLSKCVRAELKELAEFGACIKSGDSSGALALIHQGHITQIDPSEIAFKTFLEKAAIRFASEPNKSFCLLTPLREGAFGSEAINRFLAATIKKASKEKFQAPIMIAKNDHKKKLFNGELGTLTKQSQGDHFSAEDLACFSEGRQFHVLLLPRFEYAYCLSVHKSQGSEFDEVWLVLPDGSESFGRKIIYTAATRARKKMTIYGREETLCKTLLANCERLSGISAIAE